MTNSNLLLLMVSAIFLLAACSSQKEEPEKQYNVGITKEKFGRVDGRGVFLYTLVNQNKMKVQITNYGGIVTGIEVPDKDGKFKDVVLGYDELDHYLEESPYFGALVGRFANRIAHGKFVIDNKSYELATNKGNHHLHGGDVGFDKVVWDSNPVDDTINPGLRLFYASVEGEEGYPGNLLVWVNYTLTEDNELRIEYRARADQATPVNLTNHSYFNLTGNPENNILDHKLQIDANEYTVVNEELIPTGELRPVGGTPMDFKSKISIGERIDQVPGGYDHNYVLNNNGNFQKVAEVADPSSGRVMELHTDQPGMQFYSGNFLDGSIVGKADITYNKYAGFCLETQHFPDSPNHPDFPDAILQPDEVFESVTVYRFMVKK